MSRIRNSLANLPDQRNLPHRRNLPTGSNEQNGPNGPDGSNEPVQYTRTNSKAKSTVTKAHPKSPSVRTTIPRHIIEMLGWDAGDVLSWEIEKRGDKYFVIIRRLE